MRKFTAFMYLAFSALLLACGQQDPGSAIDPMTGRECFESHRVALPPGTQYEGIDKVTKELITIKIMSGVDVTTLECPLNKD